MTFLSLIRLVDPFIEDSRKKPPEIKGFSVEPFIEGSRKKRKILKWFLVESFIEGSRKNSSKGST